MYAIEWEGIRPQMLCLGKGLGSGVACSALAGESKVFECMSPGELSSTWGGNPVSSAAALAVLDAMEKEKLAHNALKDRRGDQIALHGDEKEISLSG